MPPSLPWRDRLRPLLLPARDAIRRHPGTALLLTATAALALTALLPALSLLPPGHTRLRPAAMESADLGFAWRTRVHPPSDIRLAGLQQLSTLLLAAAFVLLLLALVTSFIVTSARDGDRAAENRIRRSVGASRRMILAATLAEGFGLAGVALLLGAVLGGAALAALLSAWPGPLAPTTALPLLVAAATVGLVLVLAVFLPVAFPDRRALTDTEREPIRLVLPPVQLGLSLVALITSLLIGQHIVTSMGRTDRPTNGMVYPISLEGLSPEQRASRYAALLDRAEQAPGVGLASVQSPGTLVGLGSAVIATTNCGACASARIATPWRKPLVSHQFVSADSFRALGMRVIEGRGLTRADSLGSLPVVVINRQLAREHFQYGQAIGREMRLGIIPEVWFTVVGVVDEPEAIALGAGLQTPYRVYASVLQMPPTHAELLLRPSDGAAGAASIGPLPLPDVGAGPPITEAALVAQETAPLAWFGRGFAALGWATLGLAIFGTGALMAYWVRSLTVELGLRRAVGASRRRLLRMLLVRAAMAGAIGIAVALWVGPVVWDTLPTFLPGFPAWQLPMVLRYGAGLALIAMVCALVPAWRSLRLDPAQSLGHE